MTSPLSSLMTLVLVLSLDMTYCSASLGLSFSRNALLAQDMYWNSSERFSMSMAASTDFLILPRSVLLETLL